jgi:hypothetical protein
VRTVAGVMEFAGVAQPAGLRCSPRVA